MREKWLGQGGGDGGVRAKRRGGGRVGSGCVRRSEGREKEGAGSRSDRRGWRPDVNSKLEIWGWMWRGKGGRKETGRRLDVRMGLQQGLHQ